MKILRAKLFCRHLFWMVIWFLALHMEDLSWGLATIFMCPNVLWGLDFQSRPPQFLQVHFFVLATNFAFNLTFGGRKAGAHCGHPEMRNTSASLFLTMGRIKPAVFSDWRLWYRALCFILLHYAEMGSVLTWAWPVRWKSVSAEPPPQTQVVSWGILGQKAPLMQTSYCHSWREIVAAWSFQSAFERSRWNDF